MTWPHAKAVLAIASGFSHWETICNIKNSKWGTQSLHFSLTCISCTRTYLQELHNLLQVLLCDYQVQYCHYIYVEYSRLSMYCRWADLFLMDIDGQIFNLCFIDIRKYWRRDTIQTYILALHHALSQFSPIFFYIFSHKP